MNGIHDPKEEATRTDRKDGATPVARRTFLKASAGGAAAVLVSGPLATAAHAARRVAAPTTLRVQHFYVGAAQTVPAARFTKLLREFEAQNPGITVNTQAIAATDLNAYTQKIFLGVTAGNPVDLVVNAFNAQGGARGFFTDLGPLLAAAGEPYNYKNWAAPQREFNQVGTKVYGLQHETDTRLLYWNKALFRAAGLNPERPPTTWTELLQYARKLTKTDKSGKITQLGISTTGGENHPYWWMGLAGGAPNKSWYTFNGPVPTTHFSSPACVRGMTYLRDLSDAMGGIKAANAFNAGLSTGADPFLSGQLAMQINGDWGVSVYAQTAPKGFAYGVAPVPGPDTGGVPFNLSGGWSLAIPKGAKNLNASFKLLHWLVSAKPLLEWDAGMQYIIPRLDLAPHAKGTAPFNTYPFSAFQAEVPHTVSFPAPYWGSPTYDAYAARQDILSHVATPQAALARVDKEWGAVISDYFGL